ncbi:MAG: four helix bundle protein [Longimicrobiales bacterium]
MAAGSEADRVVYEMTSTGGFARDFGLRDQMRRAAVSVMANIAEGFERRGRREFVRFLIIAKGSTAELQAQLYVALDIGYIDRERFDQLYELCIQTGKLIGGLIRYLRTQLEPRIPGTT